jgi:hypothetical protein
LLPPWPACSSCLDAARSAAAVAAAASTAAAAATAAEGTARSFRGTTSDVAEPLGGTLCAAAGAVHSGKVSQHVMASKWLQMLWCCVQQLP